MEDGKMKRPVIGVTSGTAALRIHTLYPHPEHYCRAVHEHGGLPLTIPAFVNVEEALRYLEHVDGMIFIGGPDIPAHFYNEKPIEGDFALLRDDVAEAHLALVKAVLKSRIPFLGVCLGCQELCVGSGGKLIQHLEELTPRHRNDYVNTVKETRPDAYHFADVEKDSLLCRLFGSTRIRVNSCHHQALDPAYAMEGARIIARSTEDKVVEAIEFQDREFGLGVQWHPERIDDQDHKDRIFNALIGAAAKFQAGK